MNKDGILWKFIHFSEKIYFLQIWSTIIHYYLFIIFSNNVLINQKEALQEHYKDHPDAFSELKKLYGKLIKE